MMLLGKVWLVGAGPGDPGLLTVRGQEVLRQADVVLFDALAHPALLELCPDAEQRNVGKRYASESPSQEAITAQLIAEAQAGKRVVRLKGGDPFLFARGAEEASALFAAGIPFEVVPGIPSPLAAAAYAGISLTHRDLSSSVTFITGSDRAGKEWSPEAWKKLATATDTICVLMGMRRIEEITQAIIDGGRDPQAPAVVVQWATRPEQRVASAPLVDIARRARELGLENPAVIIVGRVAELRQALRWFDSRPLFSKKILVPRAAAQAQETSAAVRARGAEPVLFPVIEIVAPPDPSRLTRAVRELGSYDWLLFTSANGVQRFFAELAAQRQDARALGNARVGVIGPKTAAALKPHGIIPDLIASEYVGESLAQDLLARGNARRVLIPRALVAREDLPELLRAAGAEVDVVPAYQTRPVGADRAGQLAALLESGGVDVVLFTSGSTVSSVCDLLGERAPELLAQVTVASIGPITGRSLSSRGIQPDVTASEYTIAGLLAALEQHFAASGET